MLRLLWPVGRYGHAPSPESYASHRLTALAVRRHVDSQPVSSVVSRSPKQWLGTPLLPGSAHSDMPGTPRQSSLVNRSQLLSRLMDHAGQTTPMERNCRHAVIILCVEHCQYAKAG